MDFSGIPEVNLARSLRSFSCDYSEFFFLSLLLVEIFRTIRHNQINGISNFENIRKARIMVKLMNRVFFIYLFRITNEYFSPNQDRFIKQVPYHGRLRRMDIRKYDWFQMKLSEQKEFLRLENGRFVYAILFDRYLHGILLRNIQSMFNLIKRYQTGNITRPELQILYNHSEDPNYERLFDNVSRYRPIMRNGRLVKRVQQPIDILKPIKHFLLELNMTYNLQAEQMIHDVISRFNPYTDSYPIFLPDDGPVILMQ